MLTYKYRLLPTKRQHRALEAILESQRQLYNAALEERIDAYRKRGITRTFFDQCRALTEWRQSDADGASVPVHLQRWTLKRVDDAYKAFFRRVRSGGKPGFPRFRGRGRFDSFGLDEYCGVRFQDCRIRFKGMPSRLRVHVHRPLPQGFPIKCCVLHRDVQGWTVGLVVDSPEASPRSRRRVVGVDLGISTFAAMSDGAFIPSLRAARLAEKRLRAANRSLARKAKRSRGRHKARVVIGRCHAATVRARANHLHQATARLVRDYDEIAVEKLNVKGLARSVLAKDVHDASWAKFISMLRYKAACAGAKLIEVDPRNTSQECSDCGTRVPKKLSDRLHACGHCGLRLDRDLNAARNILRRAGMGPGLRNVAGCGMRAGGNLDESVARSQSSLHPN
jgi:putative transposase